MTKKNCTPKFPDSYIGEKAEEYDSLKWMERNQKKSTLMTINFLYDEKLGSISRISNSCLILDLGCGTGYSSEILIENGFRVIGVEILNDMIKRAYQKKINKLTKNSDLELILADINYLPLKADSIDHIISVSAYNFITHGTHSQIEERKVVNNTAKYLRKLLKRKGRIIIELYPESDEELDLFTSSFTKNGFEGYMIKDHIKQKSGQTFLLLKKKR